MSEKISTEGKPLEIERKFLIDYPDRKQLESMHNAAIVKIIQYYFDTENEKKLRIRRWEENGKEKFFFTRKTRITDAVRIEEEREITKEEYETFLNSPVTNVKCISKTRYRFPYNSRTVEVDFFPFWDDRAIAEVELEREDEQVILPPELNVIREVTSDSRFTNYSMAKPLL